MRGTGTTAARLAGTDVDCSVLVPVFNEERYLARSVAAMREQRFNGALEFVFADGGSTDRSREILAALALEDPRIRVLDNPEQTVSSGLNVALAHARGRWVARMDAHTQYPPDYVALGIEWLRRSQARWVSGPPIPRGENAVSRAVALALGTRLGQGGSQKWGGPAAICTDAIELDTGVFGGVWERETLVAYGGWDERWVVNEDSELAARFIASGERLICVPAMAATYSPRGSLLSLWRQYLRYGQFRAKTAVAHPHSLRRSMLLAPALVVDAALSSLAPPGEVRTIARAGIGVYAAVLAWAAYGARDAQPRGDVLLVPAVLSTMHVAHGLGFLLSAAREGPPLAALASSAGLGGRLAPFAGGAGPVFNPSLDSAPQATNLRR